MQNIEIDRYNKGQHEYIIEYISNDRTVFFKSRFIGKDFYRFLIDPEYGWREMFDKDPDYQKEFWEWMAENGYGSNPGHRLGDHYSGYYTPQFQMLTGYILEFVQERMK